jgi:uncharacterized protein YprB with RNaseH-like and TPR domain
VKEFEKTIEEQEKKIENHLDELMAVRGSLGQKPSTELTEQEKTKIVERFIDGTFNTISALMEHSSFLKCAIKGFETAMMDFADKGQEMAKIIKFYAMGSYDPNDPKSIVATDRGDKARTIVREYDAEAEEKKNLLLEMLKKDPEKTKLMMNLAKSCFVGMIETDSLEQDLERAKTDATVN